MRVVLCWAGISGYSAACWRALSAREGIDLKVLAFDSGGADTAFDAGLTDGVDCRLLNAVEQNDADLVTSLVTSHRPDVVSLPGWFHRPYVALAFNPALAGARFVMAMDTPWQGRLRQRVARFRIGGLLSRMSRVIVAGERSWQYAKRLGVPEERIRRGAYGHDYDAFAAAAQMRPAPWPRRFLFVARYIPIKGIEVLLRSYADYRASVADPWELTCCGQGDMSEAIRRAPGVQDAGFVQPHDLPRIMAGHGAFVLPSLYEPWGVALAEAAAAGLPVVCTESVGASVELVRSYFNGLTVATDNPAALAAALRWVHDHHAELPEMGRRGREMAAAFSARIWAERWGEAFFDE